VEIIEKGFTSLVGLLALKLGCASTIDRFLEKKNALRWMIVSRNGSSIPLTLYFELGVCLSFSLYYLCPSLVKCACAPYHATFTAIVTMGLITTVPVRD